VLNSVKKMEESLKRLKKGKGSSANLAGMTDDDKIRMQLYLDVKDLGEQVRSRQTSGYKLLYIIILYKYHQCLGCTAGKSLRPGQK
jgi:hypothetical protein